MCMVATYLEDVLGTIGILFLYEIRLHKRSTSMPYKISFVISIGGIILTIIACQLIILMKNIVEEMHYRESFARHYSGFSFSENKH